MKYLAILCEQIERHNGSLAITHDEGWEHHRAWLVTVAIEYGGHAWLVTGSGPSQSVALQIATEELARARATSNIP